MTRSSSLTLAERYPQGVKLRREVARQNHGSEQLIVIPWRFWQQETVPASQFDTGAVSANAG